MSSEPTQPDTQPLMRTSMQARLAYVFALDPRAARILVNAEEAAAYPKERNAYATVSDLPSHIRLAEILTEFLEADALKHAEILALARLTIEKDRTADEAYSSLHIPMTQEH